MGSRAPLILDLGNRGEWLFNAPAALSPGKNTGTNWRGGWVSSKSQSGRFEEEKNIHHQPGLEAPTVQPQLTHTKTLPNAVVIRLHANIAKKKKKSAVPTQQPEVNIANTFLTHVAFLEAQLLPMMRRRWRCWWEWRRMPQTEVRVWITLSFPLTFMKERTSITHKHYLTSQRSWYCREHYSKKKIIFVLCCRCFLRKRML